MTETTPVIVKVIAVLFLSYVSLAMYFYWQGDQLFKLLAARRPEYYKKQGEPMYFSDPISNMWAGLYTTLLVIRGLPKDFPKSAILRRQAQKTRKIGLITVLYMMALFGLWLLWAKTVLY